jgi:polysaccharide biosynthesis/export protein
MVRAAVTAAGLALSLGACTTVGVGEAPREFVAAPPEAQGAAATRVAEEHRLAPFDRIKIDVYRRPELSVQNATVDAKGEIVMPLIGPVKAGGKTRDEFTTYLTAELAKDFVNPNVTVTVLEQMSERVVLNGAVKTPGMLAVNGSTTLLQAITLGGGTDANADLRNVLVIRNIDNKRMGARYDFGAIRQGRAPDPEILPGDVIVVENSKIKSMWSQVLTSLPIIGLFTAF